MPTRIKRTIAAAITLGALGGGAAATMATAAPAVVASAYHAPSYLYDG